MKTKFSLIMVAMLLLVSCSQEETVNDLNIQEVKQDEEKLDSRSSRCDLNYVFPVYDPNLDPSYIDTWSITYAPHLTTEQVFCVRQEYFSQHGGALLRMCIFQPIDTHQDCWRILPGYPSQTTSTTIDDDPRITNNSSSGG